MKNKKKKVDQSVPQVEEGDFVDVRDVIARVEHLELLRQPGPVDLGLPDNDEAQDDLFVELASLEQLLADLAGRGGDHRWRDRWYPVTLIRDSYFEEYAMEFASDIGAISNDAKWPCTHIDWKAAADDLKQDYFRTVFGRSTYWAR